MSDKFEQRKPTGFAAQVKLLNRRVTTVEERVTALNEELGQLTLATDAHFTTVHLAIARIASALPVPHVKPATEVDEKHGLQGEERGGAHDTSKSEE